MFIIQKLMRRKKLRAKLSRQEFLEQDGESRGKRNRSKAMADLEMAAIRPSREFAHDSPMAVMALLSPLEQRALRVTWSHMKGRAGLHKVTKIMARNFETLLDRKPKIKSVYHNSVLVISGDKQVTTVNDHARILAKFIDTIVNSHLYRETDLMGTRKIGEAHSDLSRCGFDGEMWEQFGLVFSEFLALQDCVRCYPYAPRAWNVLIAALTDQFRAYYEQRIKRDSSQSLFSITPHPQHRSAPNLKLLVEKVDKKVPEIQDLYSLLAKSKSQTEKLARKRFPENHAKDSLAPESVSFDGPSGAPNSVLKKSMTQSEYLHRKNNENGILSSPLKRRPWAPNSHLGAPNLLLKSKSQTEKLVRKLKPATHENDILSAQSTPLNRRSWAPNSSFGAPFSTRPSYSYDCIPVRSLCYTCGQPVRCFLRPTLHGLGESWFY